MDFVVITTVLIQYLATKFNSEALHQKYVVTHFT